MLRTYKHELLIEGVKKVDFEYIINWVDNVPELATGSRYCELATESLSGGQFTLSTQFIKPNYLKRSISQTSSIDAPNTTTARSLVSPFGTAFTLTCSIVQMKYELWHLRRPRYMYLRVYGNKFSISKSIKCSCG